MLLSCHGARQFVCKLNKLGLRRSQFNIDVISNEKQNNLGISSKISIMRFGNQEDPLKSISIILNIKHI